MDINSFLEQNKDNMYNMSIKEILRAYTIYSSSVIDDYETIQVDHFLDEDDKIVAVSDPDIKIDMTKDGKIIFYKETEDSIIELIPIYKK